MHLQRGIATITAFVAVVLVCSFSLHTVEIHHSHPGHHTHGEQQRTDVGGFADEYLHGNEQKWFLLLLIALLGWGVTSGTSFFLRRVVLPVKCMRLRPAYLLSTEPNYLLRLLQRGILHTKAH